MGRSLITTASTAAAKPVEIANVTLNEASFTNNSYDLITTDADTSYVIKDIHVTNGYLDSIKGKINGTSIGDLTSSVSGEEILGNSSTLSIDVKGYPLTDFENVEFFYTNNGVGGDYKKYTVNGKTGLLIDEADSAALVNQRGKSSGRTTRVFKIGSSYYQEYKDNNSSQLLYYWSSGSANRSTIASASYNQFQVSSLDGYVYYFSGNSFYKHSPSGGSELIRSSISDASWSSYSRSAYSNGWFFWQPNNSYRTQLMGISVATGAVVKITLRDAYISTTYHLAVSYDAATDTFHVYRRVSGATTVQRDKLTVTKTAMDGYSTTNSFTNVSSGGGTDIGVSSMTSYAPNTWAYGQLIGHPTVGDAVYYFKDYAGSNENLIIKQYVIGEGASDVLDTGVTYNQVTAYAVDFNIYEPDAAKIAETDYDPPLDLKIRVTGFQY